jgi:Tfp pilus assembly protein PilN
VSQVNLLPREILQGQRTRKTTVMILGAGAVLVALILGFFLLQGQRLSGVEADIAAQDQTNTAIQAEIAELQRFEDLQVEAQQKQELLAGAYAGEIAYSGLLMDLSTVTPSDAYLNSLSVAGVETQPTEGEEAATGAFVGTMAVAGEALGVETVSQFLTRIEQVEGWVNPWASSVTQVEPTIDSWSYTMTVDLSDAVVTPRGKGAEEVATDG